MQPHRTLFSISIAILASCGPCRTYAQDAIFAIDAATQKQTVLGLGVELQTDSIGSGNNGLPDQPIAIPYDLAPAERARLAREMLKGFRYVRLAGGLYFRGLDASERQLEPRWPDQLSELHDVLQQAGIEGVSFEYWSPAPYWKANRSYLASFEGDPQNTLRPFGKDFPNDPVYHGDRGRFFDDFSDAVVTDIKTLERAGIHVSFFGLQNEPSVSHDYYSSNRYSSSEDYLEAFLPVASKIRSNFSSLKIIADTGQYFPNFIAPGMSDPRIANLVDDYVVHTVGADASTVRAVDAKLKALPIQRPWFQNEFEYTTGGATPERTLNTVAHIISSFEDAGNPTWFWLHALKPIGNAEASGYSLGFWKPSNYAGESVSATSRPRWDQGPPIENLPSGWAHYEQVFARPAKSVTEQGYIFYSNQPVRVHLLVAGQLPKGWGLRSLRLHWHSPDGQDHEDLVAERRFPAGRIDIPANPSGVPNAAFIEALTKAPLHLSIGNNTPIYVRSQLQEILQTTDRLQRGHWVFNMLNWSAVSSFTKRMPWDSVVLGVSTERADPKVSLLAFRRPDGHLTMVIANRSQSEKTTSLKLETPSVWSQFAYSPYNPGPGSMGQPLNPVSGKALNLTLPPLSWRFLEQQ